MCWEINYIPIIIIEFFCAHILFHMNMKDWCEFCSCSENVFHRWRISFGKFWPASIFLPVGGVLTRFGVLNSKRDWTGSRQRGDLMFAGKVGQWKRETECSYMENGGFWILVQLWWKYFCPYYRRHYCEGLNSLPWQWLLAFPIWILVRRIGLLIGRAWSENNNVTIWNHQHCGVCPLFCAARRVCSPVYGTIIEMSDRTLHFGIFACLKLRFWPHNCSFCTHICEFRPQNFALMFKG